MWFKLLVRQKFSPVSSSQVPVSVKGIPPCFFWRGSERRYTLDVVVLAFMFEGVLLIFGLVSSGLIKDTWGRVYLI